MVDVQIDASVTTSFFIVPNASGPIWTTTLIGYEVFAETEDLVYRKTIDGGATWGAQVVIRAVAANVKKLSVWYDRWTNGITGTLIHITWLDTSGVDNLFYINLDTSTDVLSGIVTVNGTLNAAGANDWEDATLSITKARGGNLYIAQAILGAPAADQRAFWRSVDDGVVWTLRDDALFEAVIDGIQLYPGNEADDQDLWIIYLDYSAFEISLKVYDDSGDTIASETLISAGINSVAFVTFGQLQYGAAIRHSDNHLLLAVWDHTGPNSADLLFFDINGAASITALTNIITAELNHAAVGLLINQNNDDVYVAYIGDPADTWATALNQRYKLSTDGGTTWGAAVQMNEDAADGIFNLMGGVSVGVTGGRFAPVWFNNDLDDLLMNFNNSVALAGVPPIPPSPNPPDPIIALAPGGQAGTIIYITPDGNEYQLITPHTPGRHVLSFQGLGTPPIEYVTQRGPFQDGETVRDFFLRPRTVQILERQNFCDRDGWWNGRSTLLDNIRPNRQTTPDGTTPGTLRFFRTDGTARDLRVFIAQGPVFEPRVSSQWDEWSFQELLRFIAHDPLLYSTTQTVSAFVIALDADLIFPITFPIQFGSGVVDDTLSITYTGTWETFPIITIVGPIEQPIINNNTTGEKLEFTIDIAPGQTVTIDLTEGAKTVVDQTGLNLIGGLTTDSDLGSFHIAPDPEATGGVNVIRLRGSNPTGATSVSLSFFTRFFGM